MHARDDDVQLGEQIRLLVEGTVVEDVDLDAGEDPEAGVGQRQVQLRDVAELRAQPVGGQAVGDGQPGRVVGDDQVVVAELARGLDHLLERRSAIGRVRVAVAVAAQGRTEVGGGVGEGAALG